MYKADRCPDAELLNSAVQLRADLSVTPSTSCHKSLARDTDQVRGWTRLSATWMKAVIFLTDLNATGNSLGKNALFNVPFGCFSCISCFNLDTSQG